jgi:hypothetical protein
VHWHSDASWKSYGDCARHIYRTGGAGAFFRGLPVCCVRSTFQARLLLRTF